MSEDVKFAIIGLGMGRNRARTGTETPGAKLVCVCDLQEEKAKGYGEEFSCDWTTSMDEVLAREDVDCVGIMTPSGYHADHVCAALHAGKHVFTTKPMEISVKGCDAEIAAAEETGRILGVDFIYRYRRANQQVKAAIDAGALGQIRLGDVRLKWLRTQEYFDGGYPAGWRGRKATEGGSLANQGVHCLDLLNWWLGPIREVYGRMGTVGHDIETEDLCFAHLTFESGAWGLIQTTTTNTPSLGTTIEISGSDGSFVWKDEAIELFQTADDEAFDVEGVDVPTGPENIIEDMVSAITKGTEPAVTPKEGRKSVQVFTAVYQSAETGKSVAIKQT